MMIGTKIAQRRKDLGLTQSEFAEKMNVTRQTVSRWENGSILPDVDKIADIAAILDVSCDYLLKDDISGAERGESHSEAGTVSRLIESILGRKVRFQFFDGECVVELYDEVCTVKELHGNWLNVSADLKKGQKEFMLPLSSVCSIELVEEA